MSWKLAQRADKMNPSVIREILKVTEKPGIISFAGGLPSPQTFPVDAMLEATQKVLTQDGRIARQLIGADSEIDKEYLVRVEGTLAENGLDLLNHGLWLDDRPLRPAKVEWINDDQLRFVLREGRKRQIRRMCELVGLKVVGLKRVRIGRVKLGDLPLGQWRFLREDERFG